MSNTLSTWTGTLLSQEPLTAVLLRGVCRTLRLYPVTGAVWCGITGTWSGNQRSTSSPGSPLTHPVSPASCLDHAGLWFPYLQNKNKRQENVNYITTSHSSPLGSITSQSIMDLLSMATTQNFSQISASKSHHCRVFQCNKLVCHPWTGWSLRFPSVIMLRCIS